MKTVTKRTMNIIATLLTTLLCFTGLPGCQKGEVDRQPDANPKITFELPEEWAEVDETEYEQLSHWSTYIPDEGVSPDEVNYVHRWKFTMSELDEDSIPLGKTAKEKAQWFYDQLVESCTKYFDCTVEPVREVKYSGIKTFIVVHNNNEGMSFDFWSTNVFLLKNNHVFQLSVRGKFEEEITQRTIKRVLETLKIGN